MSVRKINHLRRCAIPRFVASCCVLVMVALSACAHKPTKAYTTQDIDTLFMQKKLRQPIRVDSKTVFIDTRSDFAYAMLHAPQAIHVQWDDFAKNSNHNVLKKDLSRVTSRLALLGISPQSKIVVLSGGQSSWMEAGRVAWALLYIGIPDVQLVDQSALGLRYYNVMPPPRPNAPQWSPNPIDRLICTSSELAKLTASPKPHQHVLDFRASGGPLRANRFFNRHGRPNVEMVKVLQKLGFDLDDRIVVVSNHGLKSAAVTFALTAMGFRNVGNCIGVQ